MGDFINTPTVECFNNYVGCKTDSTKLARKQYYLCILTRSTGKRCRIVSIHFSTILVKIILYGK